MAIGTEERQALGEQLRYGATQQLGIVGAGETVQIIECKAAPGSAQNAEPRDAIIGVEQGACKCESIAHLGTVLQLFKIDCAERYGCLAERLGNRHEGFAGAGEDGNAIFFPGGAGPFHGRHVALNQGNHFIGLLSGCIFIFVMGIRINRLSRCGF